MVYVALIRGINVGGKNKVDMKLLASTFERVGMHGVRTYINSGNVVFHSSRHDAQTLAGLLRRSILDDFGIDVRVVVLTADDLSAIAAALPPSWANDDSAKCDVMFLAPQIDGPEILDRLVIKPGLDEVFYVPHAVLWRVDRAKVTRSGLLKIVGTDLYRQMTVRNCNTLRRLAELVAGSHAE